MAAELRVLKTKVKRFGRKPGPSLDTPAEVIVLPSVAPEFDHGLIETILSKIQRKADRSKFWRDHTAVLGDAMLDRGIPKDVVEVVLRDHLAEVRRIHQERMALPKHTRAVVRSPINFSEPPPVGTKIAISGKVARVVAIEPYVRKDGADSFVIVWDVAGRRATSGMRSSKVEWSEGDRDA